MGRPIKLKQLLTLIFGSLLLVSNLSYAAVILQYHHVSSETPAITSLSVFDFKKHMDYLKDNQFNVIALPDLMEKVVKKQAIADKTVVITFDDGYDNVYTNARPILKELGWPYTIFVNPKFIDDKYSRHMTWAQLNELIKEGVTIANHTTQHDYMVRPPKGTDIFTWEKQMLADVDKAEARIKAKTGHNYKMLAYPYGEFNQRLQVALKKSGYISLGQHSGAVGHHTNLTRVPRFPASGRYANLKTLKTKINSLPFRVEGLENANMVVNENPPKLTVWLKPNDFHKNNVNCFGANGSRAIINWISDRKFSVVNPESLPKGRSRYNCTAPSISKPGRFFWFSQPWLNMP